eukprot:TRINITY_DN21304_c0_g1_i1.p1 TRINITY_DN21304_c0_g1~~TRINITY_DN21304_c0_g1_i1.p1  ORF type:complete len:222 (+),score=21.73 TRINITY_DN21304_c0_g1_i1:37-702(+)
MSGDGGQALSPKMPFQKYKVVFLGDSSVGKTSIITRFMYDTFETSYQSTIGIDFLSKNVKVGNNVLRLQLWDTAGQERFKSMIPSYIRDSKVAVVVYDVTNDESFRQVQEWVDGVRAERGNDIVVVIVGNKIDRPEEERDVSSEAGQRRADELSALFIETSAKTEQNINNLFMKIASTLPAGESAPERASDQQDQQALDPFVLGPSPAASSPAQSSCSGCL